MYRKIRYNWKTGKGEDPRPAAEGLDNQDLVQPGLFLCFCSNVSTIWRHCTRVKVKGQMKVDIDKLNGMPHSTVSSSLNLDIPN